MTYTGGSEMKAWHEQPFCYANGPVVCSFNAWPITAEAHDWGDWCALRDSLSITHLLPTSFHLHFRLVKNEIYTLLILQAGVRGKSDITGCCGLGLRKAIAPWCDQWKKTWTNRRRYKVHVTSPAHLPGVTRNFQRKKGSGCGDGWLPMTAGSWCLSPALKVFEFCHRLGTCSTPNLGWKHLRSSSYGLQTIDIYRL